MASTKSRGVVHEVHGNATLADIKSGYIVADGVPNKQITVTGGYFKALGGAAGTATSVDVKDTANVVAVACAIAQLTENTELQFTPGATGITWTTRGPLTAGKGIKIDDTGSALDTLTSMDYQIFYTIK